MDLGRGKLAYSNTRRLQSCPKTSLIAARGLQPHPQGPRQLAKILQKIRDPSRIGLEGKHPRLAVAGHDTGELASIHANQTRLSERPNQPFETGMRAAAATLRTGQFPKVGTAHTCPCKARQRSARAIINTDQKHKVGLHPKSFRPHPVSKPLAS